MPPKWRSQKTMPALMSGVRSAGTVDLPGERWGGAIKVSLWGGAIKRGSSGAAQSKRA